MSILTDELEDFTYWRPRNPTREHWDLFVQDREKLTLHPDVASVSYEKGVDPELTLVTHPLTFRDTHGDVWQTPGYRVTLKFSHGQVSFHFASLSPLAKRGHLIHPHQTHDSGGCPGYLGAVLRTMIFQGDHEAFIYTLIHYLDTGTQEGYHNMWMLAVEYLQLEKVQAPA